MSGRGLTFPASSVKHMLAPERVLRGLRGWRLPEAKIVVLDRHATQNSRQLTRDRDTGLTRTDALREFHAPGAQR